MGRQQLPPQIKKVEVARPKTGKTVVRYQVTVDAGANPETGRRQQARRRLPTEKMAREALAESPTAAAKGMFVCALERSRSIRCAPNYIAGRHNLRAASTGEAGI